MTEPRGPEADGPGKRPSPHAVLVIVGPTAAGKSRAAMAVCEAAGGEIVSADSVQVYRGLDIGSAKPTLEERARVRHHGVDIADPASEQVDAARWVDVADAAIADIGARGRLPVVCGGTGLYVRALLQGLDPMPDVPAAIREGVRAELEVRGPEVMHAQLRALDPAAAARIEPGDPQRIGRALEIVRATGRPLSELQTGWSEVPRHRARVFGLWPADRQVLYRRIEARAAAMVEAGLVEEVRALLGRGVPADHGPLTSLGYREVVRHLRGALPAERLAEAIAAGHRKYARRQLTWFRGIGVREHGLRHLDSSNDPVPKLLAAAESLR